MQFKKKSVSEFEIRLNDKNNKLNYSTVNMHCKCVKTLLKQIAFSFCLQYMYISRKNVVVFFGCTKNKAEKQMHTVHKRDLLKKRNTKIKCPALKCNIIVYGIYMYYYIAMIIIYYELCLD